MMVVPSGAVYYGTANLKVFSGYWTTIRNEKTSFEVGHAPMSFSYTLSGDSDVSYTYASMQLVPNFSLVAGDSFDLTFYFPERVYSGDYTPGSVCLWLYGPETDSGLSNVTLIECSPDSNSLSLNQGMIFCGHSVDPTDYILDPICDSSGVIVGWRLQGTLIDALDRIHIAFYSGNASSDDKSWSGEVTCTFSSYNDLTLSSSALSVDTSIEDTPDGESILEVLNSILDYDVATWNLLAYGINRIRFIERDVASILEVISPSEQETALKNTTADVVSSYTEQVWSNDGAGFGRESVTNSFEVLNNGKDMLDSGVSVTDFFGMFGTYGWGNWFSAETRDDLDTVPEPAVIDDSGDSELSTYEKNLQEIQSFVGGG